MATDVLETGLAALAFARNVTLGLLEDIPPDKYTYQPLPNSNHALWVMGHVALTDDYFLDVLAGSATPQYKAWKDKFGGGSKPRSDASAYPSEAELRGYLRGSREQLAAWFKSLRPSELTATLPEDMRTFGATRAILMSTIACHEALHAGQLTIIRKALGIGPKFG